MNKFFIALLLTLLSINASSKILFVNGAMNVFDSQSKKSLSLLSDTLIQEKVISTPLTDADRVFVKGHLLPVVPTDLHEIYYLQQSSNQAASRSIVNNKIELDTYYKNLGEVYSIAVYSKESSSATEQRIYTQVKELYEKIRDTISSDKLLIIAHSQGNLYAEAAIAMVRYRDGFEKTKRIRMLNIGSVSFTAYSGQYINADIDNWVYKKGNFSAGPLYPLPSTHLTCVQPCMNPREDSSIESINKVTSGLARYHALGGFYLNSRLGGISGVSYPKTIGLYTKYLLDELYQNKSRKTSERVNIYFGTTPVSSFFSSKFLALLGIRSAVAQSTPSLFAYINQQYTVRVDGTGFDGNEAVSIDGSTCDKSTIQRGSGYFTQSCTGGSVAGDANKIRVYDTQYDLDIEVPTAYQAMQLRGPVIAPLAPALSEPTSGTIRLSWGAVSGATGYEISRTGQTLATLGAVTSYDDTGRTPGTMYCYRLRTIQNGTMSAYSPESCLTVNMLKCQGQWTTSQYNPGQAESRTLACPSGQTGNISQTHTCQATGQWGTTSETNTCTTAPVASCTGFWSSAKYLIGQTEEKYENTCPAGTQGQVRSWHTCQASGTSAVWGGLAQSDNCTAYLAAPTNLSASSVIGGMQLSWSPASGATRYYIYKNGDGNNYYSSVTGTSWIDANVVNGQSYSYALKAYSNLNNTSVYSPITSWVSKTFEAGNLTIDSPQNVTASRFTDGYGRKSIRLTWSTVPSVDSYLIYRRGYVNPNGSGEFLAAVNGVLNGATPEFMDYAQLNLISGNSYCYYIRAASGNNQSVNSYPDACSLAP